MSYSKCIICVIYYTKKQTQYKKYKENKVFGRTKYNSTQSFGYTRTVSPCVTTDLLQSPQLRPRDLLRRHHLIDASTV